MSRRRAPGLDARRESDFHRELLERARLWIPSWGGPDGERDFAHALLAIGARFNAEVAERLDKGADKMALGLLDWLAIRGQAAIAARMPVVFKLADKAQAVSAPRAVQLQASALGTPVVFETEGEVRLVPSRLQVVVGADSGQDAYYLPPPGLSSLDPLDPLPTQWRLRSFAAPGATTLQLDPPLGLAPGMLIEIGGAQFSIEAVNDDLVSIDPAVPQGEGFDGANVAVRKVSAFDPFGGHAINRQFHALYLGHPDLLNIESEATISVGGIGALPPGVRWHYWGTLAGGDTAAWQAFLPGSSSSALAKPKGAIATRKVGEVESRWIRASVARVPAGEPLASDALTVSVNRVDLDGACPPPGAPGGVDGVEAMANSTPLELNDIFFPLGREPRQFDAFYLGSAEAFSKAGASVRICIDMADASFASFASLRVGERANRLLAGVAQDGHLHLLAFNPGSARLDPYRKPLRPPSPALMLQSVAGLPVVLDPRPSYRPALWWRDFGAVGYDVLVAVAAGGSVWLWSDLGILPGLSGWSPLGAVDPTPGQNAAVRGLVHLEGGGGDRLFALLGTRLHVRDLSDTNGAWAPVEVKLAGADVALEKIVPVVDQAGDMGSGSMDQGLLGIGDDSVVYAIAISAPASGVAGACTPLFGDADTSIAPAALRRTDRRLLAVAACKAGGQDFLRASLSQPNQQLPSGPLERVDLSGAVLGNAIDVHVSSGQPGFALALRPATGAPTFAWWSPYNPSVAADLMSTDIPAGMGAPNGAPTLLAQHLVLPGMSGQVLVAEFNLGRQQTFDTHLASAVITPLSDRPLAASDSIAATTGAGLAVRVIAAAGVNHAGETLYEMSGPYPDPQSGDALLAYRSSGAGLVGAVIDTDKIALSAGDGTGVSHVLLIKTSLSTSLYPVDTISGMGVATLASDLDLGTETSVTYWPQEAGSGRVAPLMKLDPATTGNWDAGLLGHTLLTFPGAGPERQRGAAFQVDINRRPMLVALDREFVSLPNPSPMATRFVVDGAVDKWSTQPRDTKANPELSWEYWNGAAWWKLSGLRDETLNLKRSGAIRFDMPDDLQPSDWAGTNNHWVRARLVGGDYGQPRTVVKTVTRPDGSTEQTVERFPDEAGAPQVLNLRVQYAAGQPVLPTYVLSADSGAVRDQSDANRTAGALVSMFTHLASGLPPSSDQAQAAAAGPACRAACACDASTLAPAAGQAAAPPAAPQRALYLGFSAALAGQPVKLLVLVEREQMFDAFAPLRIEALSGAHFVPVVAEDGTRALGESGLLSLSLTLPTVVAGLFGSALCWLRLSPARQGERWTPHLRGVYINAAWARAAETMTRERLGSSIGAPGQVLLLARPPLLRDTLELRVREALSGEERDALLRADPASVVSDVASDLRGHWVLWRQVTDVDDSGALERVYSLDETSGAVRFGDGLHGMIPPIGRDAIVAFSYQRSAPGSADGVLAANAIAQRTKLNLITAVDGVEAVFAADQPAGGAAPDDPQRVRRFAPARLRHRERALSAADFEDHALQSSPDIVQARAFPDSSGLRLVIVMRGPDVQPSQAVRRELRYTLLAAAPPQMAIGRALRITGPAPRRLRIGLALRVATLGGSGQLANYAKAALSAFFDPASGGLEREGWPLGADPLDDDVALALLDAPGLEGIERVSFEEIGPDGAAAPWREAVRPHQLVMLAEDGLRIELIIVETEQ
ncbi:hypothetical protein [Massilia genomosp. 1]|uniref:hypothetical protein n=1 Tax=Massilia genomosp. 1 TaxID=2609280 RepID=UPI00141E3AD3|nr:hypothetical protein [Massilia genomosp. 1]